MVTLKVEATQILVVEDDKPTAELVSKVLLRSGRTTRLASDAKSAISYLQCERFALVLLDYMLGNDDCWTVLDAAKKLNPPTPVILVTGGGSERVAVEALRRGATDYVIKNGDYWKQLPEIVLRAIQSTTSSRLRESLASLVESSDDGIISNTVEGQVTSWNLGAQAIFGYSASEIVGASVFDLFSFEHRAEMQSIFKRLGSGCHVGNFNSVGISKSRTPIRLSIGISPLFDELKGVTSITIVARDTTDAQWACLMQFGSRLSRSAVPRRR